MMESQEPGFSILYLYVMAMDDAAAGCIIHSHLMR